MENYFFQFHHIPSTILESLKKNPALRANEKFSSRKNKKREIVEAFAVINCIFLTRLLNLLENIAVSWEILAHIFGSKDKKIQKLIYGDDLMVLKE